ncbi:DUF4810 domain-containing protein [Acinetobacter sp. WZC-1]|uniref:DUF4810 domain-containing protein n=1 Tax=Acinetobacter sp. WZC-1 TaxID=3459034 RepID=UPI00403DC150
MKRILFCVVLALGGCGTAPESLYGWGSFPQQTYLMYSAPGKALPSEQIIQLESELEKSRAKSLAVPPGLYAHLGLMYLQINNAQKAGEYFQLERQVYPESTVLMDRILKKMNMKSEPPQS